MNRTRPDIVNVSLLTGDHLHLTIQDGENAPARHSDGPHYPKTVRLNFPGCNTVNVNDLAVHGTQKAWRTPPGSLFGIRTVTELPDAQHLGIIVEDALKEVLGPDFKLSRMTRDRVAYSILEKLKP